MGQDERQWDGIEVTGGSTGIFGDNNNTVISKDFIINILDHDIRERLNNPPANIGIQRSHTAEQRGSALLIAAEQGRTEVVQQLLEDGANWRYTELDEQTCLFKAVNAGHLDVVELLLSSKDRRSFLVNHAERQWLDTPLHRVAVRGDTKIAESLLRCHPPIEAIQRDGVTALQLAVANGHWGIFKALFDQGANIYHENNNRGTVLHLASRKGRLDMLKVILEKDSNTSFLEHRNKAGDTPLFLAVLHKHTNCADLLIEYGASVHAANNDRANILHMAVANAMPVFLERQLPKFSIEEIRAKNRLGWTPLDVAYNQQRPRCVEILKARLEKG